VRELVDAGLINADSAHPYARGSLVLAVYRDLSTDVSTLKDLTKPGVKKIALANPALAPYGKAGKQALERAGLWRELEPKIVIAESVRQALVYAQRGDAEAALVGRAISQVPEIKVIEVDPQLYDPIIQALGIVKSSKRSQDARRFVEFALNEEGQGVLKEFGFAGPE
jgi:molybdate transport system substrate-binding protein